MTPWPSNPTRLEVVSAPWCRRSRQGARRIRYVIFERALEEYAERPEVSPRADLAPVERRSRGRREC